LIIGISKLRIRCHINKSSLYLHFAPYYYLIELVCFSV
jgi:hypothetical protein